MSSLLESAVKNEEDKNKPPKYVRVNKKPSKFNPSPDKQTVLRIIKKIKSL